jgi:hypothetical protein
VHSGQQMNAIQCGRQCRYTGRHTDAAKRISDAAILAWTFHGWDGTVGRWMAFSLEDGSTDHVIYDRKRDAVSHQSDEFKFLYLRLHPMGMPVCEAEIMLEFHRNAYKAGFRLADPDKASGGPDIIPRIGSELITSQIRTLRKAGG